MNAGEVWALVRLLGMLALMLGVLGLVLGVVTVWLVSGDGSLYQLDDGEEDEDLD